MFGLIRRLSHSVIPRPDRPWEDDPTSNAPHKPRKRRLSSSEQEDTNTTRQASVSRDSYAGESVTKRARGENTPSSTEVDEFGGWSVPQHVNGDRAQTPPDSALEPQPEQAPETQDVKEVTQGVKEVELEDKEEKETRVDEEEPPAEKVTPESVPLPDEDQVDELDDESEENSTKAGTTEEKTDVDAEQQQAAETTISEQS